MGFYLLVLQFDLFTVKIQENKQEESLVVSVIIFLYL